MRPERLAEIRERSFGSRTRVASDDSGVQPLPFDLRTASGYEG